MRAEEQITAVVVTYNTVNEVKECYAALRHHYKQLRIIFVDGSPRNSACSKYIGGLKDRLVEKHQFYRNIGHGQGMNYGISCVKTPYVLLCDSDAYIRASCLNTMLANLGRKTYGVGQVVTVNKYGMNDTRSFYNYLHPHFCLVSVDAYQKHKRFIHHGAPLIATMIDVQKKGTHTLVNFPVTKYVEHGERGTRKMNPEEFDPKNWDKSYLSVVPG